MDKPEVYNKDIHNGPGIYFIQSKKIPLRNNSWYYKLMVDYCLENNIITHNHIQYTIQAQLTVNSGYYNSFIDKCNSELPDDLRKLSVNNMSCREL